MDIKETMKTLEGSTILITGGTGSFGQTFIEFILQNNISATLVVYSRDESKQQELKQKLNKVFPSAAVHFCIGDIRDKERLHYVMSLFHPTHVIHAAAMKHIDICEAQPEEAIKTNVLGTQNVVEACLAHHVQVAIHLSADKAVYPAGVYGSTKQLAETLFQKYSQTRFINVRYSNVLGSRGSVIPVFYKTLQENREIKIFGEQMTRLVLTQQEVVDMVIYGFTHPLSGTIFKKCPKLFIKDLAHTMIEILGKGTYICIPAVREGEKEGALLYSEEESSHIFTLENELFIINKKQKSPEIHEQYGTHNATVLNIEQIKQMILPLFKEL